MATCVNQNCNKDPMDSPDWVAWGCDFDMACNQKCYDEARKQMDHFCGTVLPDDGLFAQWLGVPVDWVKTEKKEK